MLYQHEGTILVGGVKTLVYVELDPTQEEVLVGDETGEDEFGVIEEFAAWW